MSSRRWRHGRSCHRTQRKARPVFLDVVLLYREAQRPAFDAGRFRYSGVASASLRAVIAPCADLDDTFGHFEDVPEWAGDRVEFCWLVGDNEHGRFYDRKGGVWGKRV